MTKKHAPIGRYGASVAAYWYPFHPSNIPEVEPWKIELLAETTSHL